MALTDSRSGYGWITIINHWTVAVLILGLVAFGLILEDIPPEANKGFWIGLHKSFGLLALALTLVRTGWRVWQPAIEPFADRPAWEPKMAHLVHVILIGLAVVVPLSGVAMSLFSGHDVSFFGLYTVPAQGEVEWVGAVGHFVHEFGSYAMLAVIAAHAAAALKHHFIDGDITFRRMVSAKHR